MAFKRAQWSLLCVLTVFHLSTAIQDDVLTEALQEENECEDSVEGNCALAAIQLRGVVKHSVPEENQPTANVDAVCGEHSLGRMAMQEAPVCVRSCPEICDSSAPFVAALNSESSTGLRDITCNLQSGLSCALKPANKVACARLIELVAETWSEVPRSEAEFESYCASDQKTNGTALATTQKEQDAEEIVAFIGRANSKNRATLISSSLEKVLSGKTANPVCEHASEGQTCVPKHGDYSRSYIYCSNHKQLSPGEANCEQRRGRKSRCVGGGIGLAHDSCDDPFCRNGGAFAGNGKYCHKNSIVYCKGDDAPRFLQTCSSRTRTDWNGCTVTDYYTCSGDYPDPYCSFSYSSSPSC